MIEFKNKENIFVKESKSKGKSIYAKRDFKKEDVVFVIAGSIVTKPSIYTVPISFNLLIDPLPFCGRELCHSCNPNCGIKNRTLVVAMKDIKKGEEITIDYAMIVWEYGKEMTKENRICRCGSQNCRRKLGAYIELPQNLKQKYGGFISDYLIKRNDNFTC